MSEELIKRLREQASALRALWGDASHPDSDLMDSAADALSRPAPAVQVPDGYVLVSRKLDNETWKRLIAADVWPVTPQSFQRMLDALAPAPATVATEAVSASEVAGVKRYIQSCAEQVGDSVWGHLLIIDRLAAAASVATEAVAQGGGVDVEKVMGLVEEYGEQCEAEGYLERSGSQDAAKKLRESAYQTAVQIRALLTAAPAIDKQEPQDGR